LCGHGKGTIGIALGRGQEKDGRVKRKAPATSRNYGVQGKTTEGKRGKLSSGKNRKKRKKKKKKKKDKKKKRGGDKYKTKSKKQIKKERDLPNQNQTTKKVGSGRPWGLIRLVFGEGVSLGE